MQRLVGGVCLLAMVGVAVAGGNTNPTGTWKYTAEFNGQSIDVTIKLQLKGDKLTGTVGVNDMETKIQDGKVKDGEVSFKVVRDAGGNTFAIKYQGRVKGDTFKGKREIDRNGEINSREFEAKRVKD